MAKIPLSQADQDALDQIADEDGRNRQLVENVQPIIEPIWVFFIVLRHAPHEDDNEITAGDAYWFGLVDEVWGYSSLINSRWFEEFVADPSPPPPPAPPAPLEQPDRAGPNPDI